jgi:outer membrane protein assembly factor BamB
MKLRRRVSPIRLLCVLGVIGLVSSAAGQKPAPIRLQARRPGAAFESGFGYGSHLPLVETVDEEVVEFLEEARRINENTEYKRAVEILENLQALIERAGEGFVPAGDGVFVSLSTRARAIVGGLSPKALELYRGLFDGKAQALFEKAVTAGKVSLLRQVADQYLYTSSGPKALDELAAVYFDRGRFSHAADCWRRMLELRPEWVSRPLLLARIACASHLAGETAEAYKILETLRKDFPGAAGQVAGGPRNLADFVEEILKTPPASPARRGETSRSWPGLGGIPTGLSVMPDCDAVLAPVWSARADLGRASLFMAEALIASEALEWLRFDQRLKGYTKARSGHVLVDLCRDNQKVGQIRLPATVHPVVVGDEIIYRTDEKVVARDLMTGRKVWEAPGVPLLRGVSVPERHYSFGRSDAEGAAVGDRSRYMLTAADGKVFVRHSFLPPVANLQMLIARMGVSRDIFKNLSDHSALAALSAGSGRAGGKVLWQIGLGEGDDEVVRAGKFVSAPTYHAGRLYVAVLHVERYYLVCLDAETGRTIWRTVVCQPPSTAFGHQGIRILGLGRDDCSPPAVSEGKVFVLPNLGVLVALEAETGKPLWAHHYDSWVNSPLATGSYRRRSAGGYPSASVNPVILTGRRVISLPSDSDSVIAVGCDNGRLLWRVSRSGCSDLSALGAQRVLLSGPSLVVLSAEGKRLSSPADADGIVGRPAVTRSAVLASGQGRLYRLDLKTYKLTKIELVDADGLLGNLLSTGQVLIAANPAGLCAYFSFDAVLGPLDEEIDRAEPMKRARLLFRKAQLAFGANRLGQALEVLLASRRLARQLDQTSLEEQLRTWTYRCYVALGNRASDPRQMQANFEKALGIAATDQERAHMKLRLAKVRQRMGDLVGAAALVQEISESFAAEELVDVPIGARADASGRFERTTERRSGRDLGQRLIRGFLEEHGRGLYEQFDRIAGEALAAARSAGDPEQMRAVYERWPNSDWADDAMYAAAEAHALMSGAGGSDAGKHLQEARYCLSVVTHMPESDLRLQAGAALAALYAQDGKLLTAGDWCAKVRSDEAFAPAAQVEFGRIRGRLDSVLAEVERECIGRPPVRQQQRPFIRPPLRELFSVEHESICLLRDQEFRPVMLGEKALALRGDKAILVDISARDGRSAITWAGLAPMDYEEISSGQFRPPGKAATAGLSKDKKTVIVACPKEARGFDVETGKVRWRWQTARTPMGFTSVGEGVLLAISNGGGEVVCLDGGTGRLRWRGFIRGGVPQPSAAPVIASGVALVAHDSSRRMTCFDLSNGKVICRLGPCPAHVQALITPLGYLALIRDGKLLVREIQDLPKGRKKVSGPIWQYDFGEDEHPRLLAVNEKFIAVRPSLTSDQIHLFTPTGGARPLAILKAGKTGRTKLLPVAVVFDEQSLYAICSTGGPGWRRSTLDRWVGSAGLSIQIFDLGSGRLKWQKELETDPRLSLAVVPPTMGRDHLLVVVRAVSPRAFCRLYVLDVSSGQENMEAIDLARLRRNFVTTGSPVMVGGRLCFESGKGLRVYGNE